MPAPGNGPFAIELCPAAQPTAMIAMAPVHAGHSHHADTFQHDRECSFSPFSAAFAVADAPAPLPIPPTAPDRSPAPVAAVPLKTGPPALLPPATGPPALG